MASNSQLTIETFLAGCEMVFSHLRTKEADRWSSHVCRLKFYSFTTAYPEISEAQFFWAAEQWIQTTKPETFHRFPTWNELMRSLYRCEGGLANRSWGPREGLPAFLRFTEDQLLQLPPARSVLEPPDPQNSAAYVPIGRGAKALAPGEALRPELPPSRPADGPKDRALTRALLREHMERGRAAEAAAEEIQKERLRQLTTP
jgi:hypothetical protein